MAVNTSEILSVYDALINSVKTTLTEQYDNNRITGEAYASVLSSAIVAVIQQSVASVQGQPLTDAQVAQAQAQTSSITAQSTADVSTKTKQGLLIDAQKDTEVEKKLLTTRQKNSYDDNLRIEEAKASSGVVGMAWAGGTVVDSTAIATMWSKIDAITP